MLKLPLEKPEPNIDLFIKTIRGETVPDRPPLVELFLDGEVVKEISCKYIGRQWVDWGSTRESQAQFYTNWMEVYHKMGYDYIRMSGGLFFPGKWRITDDTAELSRGNRTWTEQGTGPIANWDDFEQYPWPDPHGDDLWAYEFVAKNIPEGMGLFVCPGSGFLEQPLDHILGYENMCYLMYDDPKLVEAVCEKVGSIITRFYQRLLGLPGLVGFFQGDDMGFKTGTLIGANDLRKYIFPWHKKLAGMAHDNGLLYFLHSCGCLEQITEDLIEDVKIDGRHSYEDEGNSVFDFKRKYGNRTAVLGGVDLHKLTTLPENELRAYVRRIIDECHPTGRFALGSGNTVCNYVPVKNYFIMVEEALNYGRG